MTINTNNDDISILLGGGSVEEGTDHLDDRLKKTISGYSKQSVIEYINDLEYSQKKVKENFERQIADLMTESSNLSKECAILRSQIADLEEGRKRAESDLQSEFSEKNHLIQENKELNSYRERFEAVSQDVAKYKRSLDEKIDLIERYEQELANKDKSLKEYETMLRDLDLGNDKDAYAGLKKDNESMKIRIAELENAVAKYDDIESKIAQAQDKYTEILAENRALYAEKNKIQRFINDFQEVESYNSTLRNRNNSNTTKALISIINCVNDLSEEVKYQQEKFKKTDETVRGIIALVNQIRAESDELQEKNLIVFDELQKTVNELK